MMNNVIIFNAYEFQEKMLCLVIISLNELKLLSNFKIIQLKLDMMKFQLVILSKTFIVAGGS